MLYESIAEIAESELVERLVGSVVWREMTLFSLIGMDEDATCMTRVNVAGLPGDRRGDVDILRVNSKYPERAVAIQVKRVKVSARAIANGQPNKLRELEDEAVCQTNLLTKIGFSQVYLYALTVVDSREQNAGRITYDGAPNRLRSAIYDTLLRISEKLDPRVGLMHCEAVQPMDSPPLTNGSHGTTLYRRARSMDQPAKVTGWVARQVAVKSKL